MNLSFALANRFREVLLDGKWIANTNFQEALSDVDFKIATTKVYNLNTIALLTYHINYYVKGVLDALDGKPLTIKDKLSFDIPKMQDEKDWESLKNDLLTNSKQFGLTVEKLSDKDLDVHFVEEKYGDYRRNINGMIEHCYYHLGQIIIIKKILKTKTTETI